jgi:C_GCAxxG_C_C family probable redox protein
MKDHVKEAQDLFESGFNCTQSVLLSFCEEFGLSKETASKMACPFGGGIGGHGKICGAITGAMMVIGLKYGSANSTDLDSKKISSEKAHFLLENFEEKHGSCDCNDLIGCRLYRLNPEELKVKRHHIHSTCPKFLETVIVFIEEEL